MVPDEIATGVRNGTDVREATEEEKSGQRDGRDYLNLYSRALAAEDAQ